MQLFTFHSWTLYCFVLLFILSSARAEAPSADDEQALRRAGLSTDGASLLAAVRKHTLTTETRKKVDGLIARLGDESFIRREKASKELFALGRLTLPQLCAALPNKDAEVARRAKLLIERIEREPAHPLPAAAVRLLAVRKPAGAVGVLLAYLPHAEEEALAEEVQKTLAALAQDEEKTKRALQSALEDAQQPPAVRRYIALALAIAGEREAVPVLIDLLAVLPVELASQVEEKLYQLAGDTAPKTSEGAEPTESKKCRDAWTAWWKTNAKRVDLARLTDRRGCGFTLICDLNGYRVYEIDHHGKERWAINNLLGPTDAVVLPGHRVLIAEEIGNKITERDFQGKILWSKEGLPGPPINVQRLPNGNTFIAIQNGPIMEIDRTGKEVALIDKLPGSINAAYRSRQGCTYVLQNPRCVVVDVARKPIKDFICNPNNFLGGIELSSNGRILVSQFNKVVEFDHDGKKMREVDAPAVTTSTSLPDGHILVASQVGQRVYELDRAGKVVWEHKGAGHAVRARRR